MVGKGKRRFVQPLVVNTPLRRSGTARVLKGSHSFSYTPRVHPLTDWTILCLPSRSWFIYRPRRDGRLSWPRVAGWLHTGINELNPDTVVHLSTNRARCRLTSLIEANALTTTPDHRPIPICTMHRVPNTRAAAGVVISIREVCGPVKPRDDDKRWRSNVMCLLPGIPAQLALWQVTYRFAINQSRCQSCYTCSAGCFDREMIEHASNYAIDWLIDWVRLNVPPNTL